MRYFAQIAVSTLCIVLTCQLSLAAETNDTACRPVRDQFYSDRERGWYFKEYCIPKKPEEPKKKVAKEPKHAEKPDRPEINWARIQDPKYLDKLTAEEFRKLFEQAKEEVVYNPSKGKMLAYLKMQDYMREKSLTFSYVWRDVLLENPELDQTVKNPGSNYGAIAKTKIESKEKKALLTEMADTVGLFFFVAGDCPYCHEQTNIVNMLMADYGLTVRTVSQDYCHNVFTNCSVDSGGALFSTFGIKATPTLLAVFKGQDDKPVFQPVATGIVTLDDIVTRLVFYYRYHKTGTYPSS